MTGNSIAEINPETLGSFPPKRATRRSQYPCPWNMEWGDGTTQSNPVGVRACPPWQKGQAGRWHGPCPSTLKPWAVVRCSLGRCARRYSVLAGTPNPPHPSRGSRTEHEP